jgi:hypothetical protein
VSDDRGSLQVIARHMTAAVAPLDRGFRDAESFRQLMWRLGWEVQGLPPQYVTIADAVVTAVGAAAALADDPTPQEVIALINAVGQVYQGIEGLGVAPPGVNATEFLPGLARNLFEYLLAEYLRSEVPRAYSALALVGVIWFEDCPKTATRPAFVRTRFDWDRIPDVLSDPASIPQVAFGWGTNAFDFRKAANLVSEFTLALGLPTSVDRVGSEFSDAIQSQATGAPVAPIRVGLTVPFFSMPVGDAQEEIGLMVTELPAEGASLPGMLIGPMVPNGVAASIPLSGDWSFQLRAGTDLAEQLGLVLRPDGVSVRYPFAPGRPLPSAGFGASLIRAAGAPRPLFGDPGGTRLEMAGATIVIEVDLKAGDVELKFAAEPKGLALVLSAGGLDGFLGSLLGGQELRLETPLRIAWSNRTGLDFMIGAGLEVSLSPHLDFGLVRIDAISLAMRFTAGANVTPALDVRVAASLSGDLGPVAYTVDQLGVHLPVRFTAGNAGPFDVGFDVLWPTGLGLVVDVAGVVTGGGFISLNQDTGRYVGIIDLKIYEIGVTAIGILDTKDGTGRALPSPGFSLIIAISAQFPPIQLGYGFTLNGVGGLAAINRRLDTDAFLAGVRQGAVDSILFPDDPVGNATTIVSNLTTIFPIAIGRYVFGPMALLGWGTPTLVRAELGILIEVPDPITLAFVGQASVLVPEGAPVVALHIDIVAVVDTAKSLFALDATIHDSYVAAFSLSGDMAMRLTWGSQPNFALAVGGLNPGFEAPAGFPTLRRVTVALGMGENPRVSLEGYFATTSNSLQFGARAELYAEAGGFSVQGWLAFDALLVYQPLSFRFDFSVGMAIYHGSSRLAGVTVEGHLTGPSPFHVWGQGSVSLLFFDVSVPFDQTFGERKTNTLPPADPWPELEAAIQRAENWHGELAATVHNVVTLRPPPDDPTMLLLYPMGSATLRQKVLPFNRQLERFGEYAIQGPDRYDIAGVEVGSSPAADWRVVTDHFAPGKYEALSETDKLSRPSFETMDAGVSVGGDFVDAPAAAMKVAQLEYETSIVDAGWKARELGRFGLERTIQLIAARRGSAALALTRSAGAGKFAGSSPVRKAVVLDAETYAAATTDRLEVRDDIAVGATKGAALQALKYADHGAGVQIVPSHELVGVG